jgi:hypothetical protein
MHVLRILAVSTTLDDGRHQIVAVIESDSIVLLEIERLAGIGKNGRATPGPHGHASVG